MKKTTIDINESTIKKYVESLRSDNSEIRAQLDFGYSYDGKLVHIFHSATMKNNRSVVQKSMQLCLFKRILIRNWYKS